jgi:hypothetical protein
MNQVTQSIGVSVLASVITLALFGVYKLVWNWCLQNIWLRITCRHVLDIQGVWAGDMEYHDLVAHEVLTIRQYGWRVAGTIDYSYQENGARVDK